MWRMLGSDIGAMAWPGLAGTATKVITMLPMSVSQAPDREAEAGGMVRW